jgi:dihydrofolate reductase
LPGRDIFLVGRYGGNFPDEEIRQRVVKAQRVYNPKLYLSDKNSPAVNIQVALERLRPDQKLFIAGGKSMYEAYLKYCDVIYATVIKSTYPNIKDPVKMEPETFKTLSDRTKYVISYDNQEFYNGLEAEYYVLQKIMTPTNQQVLPHQNYIP